MAITHAEARDTPEFATAPATRATILDAARFLAMRDGFASFSMESVAARSGFSRRTVYNQFENRDSLYRSAIQSMMDVIEEEIDIALPAKLPLAAAVRLFCTAAQQIMMMNQYQDIIRAIDRDGRDAPWLERLLERRILLPLRSRIELYLMSKMAKGALPFTDVDEFCCDFMATLEASAGVGRARARPPFTLEEVVDVMLRRVSSPFAEEAVEQSLALAENIQ
jgi:AcrR family transcriptional regulator